VNRYRIIVFFNTTKVVKITERESINMLKCYIFAKKLFAYNGYCSSFKYFHRFCSARPKSFFLMLGFHLVQQVRSVGCFSIKTNIPFSLRVLYVSKNDIKKINMTHNNLLMCCISGFFYLVLFLPNGH
jgi:hypothetical protein